MSVTISAIAGTDLLRYAIYIILSLTKYLPSLLTNRNKDSFSGQQQITNNTIKLPNFEKHL